MIYLEILTYWFTYRRSTRDRKPTQKKKSAEEALQIKEKGKTSTENKKVKRGKKE